jgi:hypothetical protein
VLERDEVERDAPARGFDPDPVLRVVPLREVPGRPAMCIR